MKAKAIRAHIFEDKRIGNCSNHGISERYDCVLLLCDDGDVEVDLENPPENLCEIVRRRLWGEEHDYIRPWAAAKGVGWMFGGSIIYSSDARFGSNHPLMFHDRDETPEEYEMYSR